MSYSIKSVAPKQLTKARIELHWAAQLASAPGMSLGEVQADDSHTNLEWVSSLGALAGIPVGANKQRAALILAEGKLILLGRDSEINAELELQDTRLDTALAWLTEHFDGAAISRREFDLPAHIVAEGGTFHFNTPEQTGTLASWYSFASQVLSSVRDADSRATPIRCWPHHFDIATLIPIDDDGSENARSVGVGLSPGDGTYAEPYFYVTPWPYPKPESYPSLPAGKWHTEGWTGTILRAEEVVSASDPADISAQFVDEAVKASLTLLKA